MERFSPLQAKLTGDPRDRLSVIGNGVVQLAKLVKLSKPEIFTSTFVSDCSEGGDIGCIWSQCKDAWNAKSNKEQAIDWCFDVTTHLIPSNEVSSRISVLAVLSVDGLSRIVHVPGPRHPIHQCRHSRHLRRPISDPRLRAN